MKISNFLSKWLLVSLILLTLGVGNMWGETSTYSASANTSGTNIGKIDGWSGNAGTYTGSGNQSVKFDDTGDNYTKRDIWSGVVSSGMTALTVTLNAKINGEASKENAFTVNAVNSSGTVLASKTLTESWSGSFSNHVFELTGTFSGVTGLELVYTKKGKGNVGVKSVSATVTYTTASCSTNPTAGTASLNGTF